MTVKQVLTSGELAHQEDCAIEAYLVPDRTLRLEELARVDKPADVVTPQVLTAWFDFVDCYGTIQEAERVCYKINDCYILVVPKLDVLLSEYVWTMNSLKRLATLFICWPMILIKMHLISLMPTHVITDVVSQRLQAAEISVIKEQKR